VKIEKILTPSIFEEHQQNPNKNKKDARQVFSLTLSFDIILLSHF
jgi:hypothetical protein